MNKVIVLVDDEEVIVNAMKQYFSALIPDQTFMAFTNPKNALEYCVNNKIDFLITDINMPEMTGFDLINSLRDNDIKPKIFILSGFYSNEHQKEFSNLGDFSFFTKPVKLKDLTMILKSKLVG